MTIPKINLVGYKFGKLTVIKQAEDKIDSENKHRTMWWCNCECGTKNVLASDKSLKDGKKRSCGCLRKHMNLEDLTGQKFGRLTVDKLYEDNTDKVTKWICHCDCGNKNIIVRAGDLKNGTTKSCGCIRKEVTSKRTKRFNTYDLSGDYGIGYTTDGKEFYFDLEDYDLIKNYCWYIRDNGYVINKSNGITTHMHRLVMGIQGKEDNIFVDHISNQDKNDNRKRNLRLVTHSENMQNVGIRNNNTSGCTGVNYDKKRRKWRSRICCNKTKYELGLFDEYEDAVKARKEAEIKYFGEHRHIE